MHSCKKIKGYLMSKFVDKEALIAGFRDGVTRRGMLRGSAAVLGAAAIGSPLSEKVAKAEGYRRRWSAGYGALRETRDISTGLRLLSLPRGFEYASFGWTGDALRDGSATPRAHDGMAVVDAEFGRGRRWWKRKRPKIVTLVRNHEIRGDTGVFSPSAPAYDPAASGGNTNLTFDMRRREWIESWASLTGTITNCAGGPTPWNSWLTCEEDTRGKPGDATYDESRTPNLTKNHGYVFDVPAEDAASATPIRGMGRFVHEATATDPNTYITYLTEDRSVTFVGEDGNEIEGAAGFFRFVPDSIDDPTGNGTLQMLKVKNQPQADLSGFQASVLGNVYDVEWVTIDDPEAHVVEGSQLGNGVFWQGFQKGGAAFQRGEGAWYGNDLIYFISTSGGPAREGIVWAYDPYKEQLFAFLESDGPATVDNPDNIAVSPRGGILLCEDGNSGQYMIGVTQDGEATFRFARNTVVLNGTRNDIVGDFVTAEFAGATWDPSGEVLFCNIQTPGITFAIWGPWERGAL